MKFLCKIFGHQWGYNYEHRKDMTSNPPGLPLLEKVRCCYRCKVKEFPWWNEKTGELIFGPSIEEQRDIKLRKLGIK
jgi:hypothetical protein